MRNSFLYAALGLLAATAIPASAEQSGHSLLPIRGQYEQVTPPQATSDPAEIEVVELFWYGCPHCYDFEPYLKRWARTKPSDVSFKRIPAIFRQSWVPHAQAYYAAEALGVLDQFHEPLFEAMHKDKRRINGRGDLAAFAAEQGIDKEAFLNAYDSFAVRGRVRQASMMTQRYGITGVPSVVVNGKYRTSGSLAGTFDKVLEVVDDLVAEERRTNPLAASGDSAATPDSQGE